MLILIHNKIKGPTVVESSQKKKLKECERKERIKNDWGADWMCTEYKMNGQ